MSVVIVVERGHEGSVILVDRCFQLMETDDPTLFEPWIAPWQDLVSFEVVPVISSAEAASRARA